MSVLIYVASPLGFSEAGRYFYEEKFLPLLTEVGFNPLDPWKLTDQKVIDAANRTPFGTKQKNAWQKTNRIIGRNNFAAIEKSKIIAAVLDGTDVDSGTACEIGYGTGLGKPTIGYRGDFRLSSDNIGSIVNLQVEYSIRLLGGVIVTSLAELKPILVHWHRKLSSSA